MKEHFMIRYSSSEDNDTIMDLEMNFDNPTDEMLVKRLTDWLIAIGKNNINIIVIQTIPTTRATATPLLNDN
jgi:hypothetical protein